MGKSKHLDAKKRTAMLEQNYEDNEEVFYAAADGDLLELISCSARGLSLINPDYDGRTPLHVAASNGHNLCVRYLLVQVKAHLSLRELFVFIH